MQLDWVVVRKPDEKTEVLNMRQNIEVERVRPWKKRGKKGK